MFQAVTKFQTIDGKLHDSEKKAKEYALDQICEKLDRHLEPWFVSSGIKIKDRIAIVESLTSEDGLKLLNHILNSVEY
jgi:hypothetical protein